MKIAAIIFICYEIFKLVTLKKTLALNDMIRNMVIPPYKDQWQLYVNMLYLTFAIVLLFFKPVIGIASLVLSLAVGFVSKKVKGNNTLTALVVIMDGIASIFILGIVVLG